METVKTTYLGQLRTEAIHVRSGNKIITDAPIDNQGKGEAFSPTDLLVTSLCSCMFTIIGIAAQTGNFNIDGATAKTTKVMASDPRRVGEAIIEFDFSKGTYSDKQKTIIQRAVETCPVAKSIHPELKLSITYKF